MAEFVVPFEVWIEAETEEDALAEARRITDIIAAEDPIFHVERGTLEEL